MSILVMCKKVFKKNISAIIFGAVLLIFNISNVYSAGFYGGEEFQINTYISHEQSLPSVAFLNDDRVVVVWNSYGQDGSHYGIYAQIFDVFGNKIGNEFQVNTHTYDYQHSPSVAALNNGSFIVAWHSNADGSLGKVYAQIFDKFRNKVGDEFRVNTYTTAYQRDPCVASFNDGGFVVVWHSAGQDGSEHGIYAQIFDSSGVKIGDEFRVNNHTNNSQAWPSVISLNNGNFVVVWAGFDISEHGVYAQIFDKFGDEVGNEFQVNAIDVAYTNPHLAPHEKITPVISALANNNFVIVWMSNGQDGSNDNIHAQIFSEYGVKIGDEFRVNTYTINSQSSPSVAALSDGGFVVTWYSNLQDGSGKGVYAQAFSADGTKLGYEFKVNTYVTGDQDCPSVAALANNSFIIAWDSYNQDGSEYGVFGRIFHLNAIPAISGLTKSGTKNTALTFNETDFTNLFTDADGHSMTKIKITSLPNNGDLKLLSSGAVSEDQEIDVDDIEDLVFDPDKDWTGTTNFGWQGYDGTDYSDAGVVTIKVNDGSSESGEWWPVVTGGTLAVITGIVTVATALIIHRFKLCCKKQDDDPANSNSMGDTMLVGNDNTMIVNNNINNYNYK